jgi:secernin
MGCDLVVAVGRATADGRTLFGRTCSPSGANGQILCVTPARLFAPGEKVRTALLELSQARQTYGVLACRAVGSWGYEYGLNEHQVAAGCTPVPPALDRAYPGLLGSDLVRLVLERSRTARQAVEVLTGLIEQHGQGTPPGEPARDNAFLIADPREAYAVETAGKHWVYQEIQEVRAVGSLRVVRQDWDRISHGLAPEAIARGWWPEDGSKLDFAGTLGEAARTQPAAWRRWGQLTVLLHDQNGHIDTGFLRRLIGEPAASAPEMPSPAPGFICQLSAEPSCLPLAWSALSTACGPLYFPLFLTGDLPAALTEEEFAHQGRLWRHLRRLRQCPASDPELGERGAEDMGRLQARLDQETEEFMAEVTALDSHGTMGNLHREASLFMEHHLEKLEEVLGGLLHELTLASTIY